MGGGGGSKLGFETGKKERRPLHAALRLGDGERKARRGKVAIMGIFPLFRQKKNSSAR